MLSEKNSLVLIIDIQEIIDINSDIFKNIRFE